MLRLINSALITALFVVLIPTNGFGQGEILFATQPTISPDGTGAIRE